jgi:hypothetical protein
LPWDDDLLAAACGEVFCEFLAREHGSIGLDEGFGDELYCTPFVNPFLRESRIIHVLYQFHSCNFSQ